jgi:hypothetical protein
MVSCVVHILAIAYISTDAWFARAPALNQALLEALALIRRIVARMGYFITACVTCPA